MKVLVSTLKPSSSRVLSLLIAATAACGLAGCGAELIEAEQARRITKERVALLKRQPAPSCEYRTASLERSGKQQTDVQPPATDAGTNPDAAMRAKLDYERQCYRHAEMIARTRLINLQAAVAAAAKSGYRAEGNTWEQ